MQIEVPIGTEAPRQVQPIKGSLRPNEVENSIEQFDGNQWITIMRFDDADQ